MKIRHGDEVREESRVYEVGVDHIAAERCTCGSDTVRRDVDRPDDPAAHSCDVCGAPWRMTLLEDCDGKLLGALFDFYNLHLADDRKRLKDDEKWGDTFDAEIAREGITEYTSRRARIARAIAAQRGR